jgi:hypothetical protein
VNALLGETRIIGDPHRDRALLPHIERDSRENFGQDGLFTP